MAGSYRIVVGLDFSELAHLAFHDALSLAKQRPSAELHVVAVVDKEASEIVPVAERRSSLVEITDNLRERLIADVQNKLAEAGAGGVTTLAHVRVGAIAEQIAGLAGEIGADLVVLGTHGRQGLRRLMLGSVAESTVRLAPCPVLVVRPKDLHVMDNIPTLEPPCPECVKAREASGGAEWWCEPHKSQPPTAHEFSFSRRLDQPPEVSPYR